MISVIADCGIYGTVGTWSSYQVYEATYTPLLLFYFYCMCRGKCRGNYGNKNVKGWR